MLYIIAFIQIKKDEMSISRLFLSFLSLPKQTCGPSPAKNPAQGQDAFNNDCLDATSGQTGLPGLC
jgi:hypothetical protein